jgi:hypothetical protein
MEQPNSDVRRMTKMMRMRPIACLGAALVLSVLTAWPAQAAGGTSAVCSILMSVGFSPGLTMTPGSGTKGTDGESGSISCQGRINGHHVTGPGTFGFEGTYTASSCLSGTGSGTYFGTVPTDAGPMRFSGTFSQTWVGLVFQIEAEQPGAHFTATAVGVPTQGDCIRTPLTQAAASMTAFGR